MYVKFDVSLWMPLRCRIPELTDAMLDPLPHDPSFASRSALDTMAEMEVYPPGFDEIWKNVALPEGINEALGKDGTERQGQAKT